MVARLILAAALVAASLVFFVSSAPALTQGKLDTSFSGDGVATTAEGLGEGSGNGVFVQPDSKIVVVGSYWNGSSSRVEIARFLPDGSPDPSFGTFGRVDTSAIAPSVYIHGGALNADGTILAVGRVMVDEEWVVVRVTSSGVLDTSFNGSGWLSRSVNFHPGVPYSAVTQEGSGRVIVAGIAFGIARSALLAVNKDGSPITDDSWGDPGQSGTVLTDVSPGFSSKFLSIFELPNRNLLSVGWAEIAGGTAVGMTRLLPNGQLDTRFGRGGVVVTPLPGQQIEGAAIDGRGRVLIASTASVLNGALSVSRLTAAGVLDRSFGNKGTSSLASGTSARSVAVAPDGKIVVGGSGGKDGSGTFLVARFTAGGLLDKSFGKRGVAQKYFPMGPLVNATAVQTDGKIIGAGTAIGNITLARFTGVSDPPASKIASPAKANLRRRAFTRISGKASPGAGITGVEVAIRRIDSRQLRKKRCLWVKDSKGKIEKVADARRRCTKQIWLKASGLKSWRYKFKKLPAGTYRIYSRATINLGVRETKFSSRHGNFRTLVLKR